MFVELLQNISVLIAIAFGLELFARRLAQRPMTYRLLVGLMFGTACIVGMMTPLHLAPGVIYDGRSVILSLAGLFGGPLAAAIAVVMSGGYRLFLGGPGAQVGLLVILEASLLGILLRQLISRNPNLSSPLALWLFGVVVHLGMLALQLLLPGNQGLSVIRQIGPPVLLFFPLGFLLAAKALFEVEKNQSLKSALASSEARQKSMIACSPLALFSIDPQSRVLSWNESSERLFGWTAGEVLGTTLPIVPPELMDRHRALRQRVLDGETLVGVEFEIRRKDGTVFPARLAASVMKGPGEEILGVFAAIEDITEHKQAEKALHENEQRYRSLVEGAPDAIFVQTDWNFVYLNRKALEHFGAESPEQLLGTRVLDRIHPGYHE
jgi:PAS domain S-box-containing protein